MMIGTWMRATACRRARAARVDEPVDGRRSGELHRERRHRVRAQHHHPVLRSGRATPRRARRPTRGRASTRTCSTRIRRRPSSASRCPRSSPRTPEEAGGISRSSSFDLRFHGEGSRARRTARSRRRASGAPSCRGSPDRSPPAWASRGGVPVARWTRWSTLALGGMPHLATGLPATGIPGACFALQEPHPRAAPRPSRRPRARHCAAGDIAASRASA